MSTGANPRNPSKRQIDTESAAEHLRTRVINVGLKQVLISRIAESDQAQDLKVPPNCKGFGRIRHFHRKTTHGWPTNPLPIVPATFALHTQEADSLRVQAFQNSACAWRCWYCFVPFAMLSGSPSRGAWMTADELVELYLEVDNRPAVIDLTGGSPDLTPEWVLWMMRALRNRGLDQSVYLWSDDNLSTDYFWRYLTPADREEVVTYPMYGRVACFKGFCPSSFAFNTGATPKQFAHQFHIMDRLCREGIDCYCYATFTATPSAGLDAAMRDFVDRLQRIHPNLPLRTVPLRIETFSPVHARLNDTRRLALAFQDEAISAWNSEVARRFSLMERSTPINRVSLGRT